MDGFSPFQEGDTDLTLDELSNYSALMNMDPFTEQLFSSFISDQFFSQFNYSAEQRNLQMREDATSTIKDPTLLPEVSPSSIEMDNVDVDIPSSSYLPANGSSVDDVKDSVPRSIVGDFLVEKLLKALSLLKQSSGRGILAQVWMPFKKGDKYVLSTSEQPYLLDHMLAGYREISRTYTFPGNDEPGSVLGLPGRVFISGMPEWTSNIVYYSRLEYLRMDHAISYKVRGSLALPIFSPDDYSCSAVLELVTKKEKPDFDLEMDSVCEALQAVNLKCVKEHAQQKNLKMSQRSALAEILDVLRVACHAHMLPLALTWIPFNSVGGLVTQETKTMLCIHESACYVNDGRMQAFLHACSANPLHNGQGTAGKAFQSNHPVFSSDVKEFDVHQYPLAHHARKFGLHAAVAIRLRSTYTGNDDYILEFFLPVNCIRGAEQQLLLNNFSATLQRTCRNLRTVSCTETLGSDATRVSINHSSGVRSHQTDLSIKQIMDVQVEQCHSGFQIQETGQDKQGDTTSLDQTKSCSSKRPKKRSSKEEKNIGLNVLQQYYSGTLRDAAKSIGVCPTTLKKICRQNGISRWPSRKINKVNHSVKKIQSVIDSVPGVTGKIKFDSAAGLLITEVSSLGPGEMPVSSEQFVADKSFIDIKQTENYNPLTLPYHEEDRLRVRPLDCAQAETHMSNQKQNASDGIIGYSNVPRCSNLTDSSSGSASSDPNPKRTREMSMLPADEEGLRIRVKATYKEDTVCFKFFPSMSCDLLLEEIMMRFKLPIGTFQLKYKDDEDEWIILASDSDLQECIEMLEGTGSKRVRLLVRDIPSAISSSSSSNNLLIDS